MTRLVAPTTDLHESFLRAHREWAGSHQDGAGLHPDDDVESVAGFATWVGALRDAEHDAPAGLVTCTFRWVVEDSPDGPRYLGSIALRHALTPYLLDRGGHVGYGIRPSARRRGLATWALAQVLPLARERGMDRVLATCDDDNVGSARTIERNGGVLEDVRIDDQRIHFRRYWIDLARGARP